ncbi:MAG: hypothetical protein M3433_02640 [Actinomycetota bacterium]|nr:hypothetical protein [Actinomycetota bacterium]
MSASAFTPEVRGALIERTAAGVSMRDACRVLELREKTVAGWLARGRREDSGPYADFVRAIEAAREDARSRPEPMTVEEHRLAVSEAARQGSVQALKLYWEMLRARDTEEPAVPGPVSKIDELAAKRRGA